MLGKQWLNRFASTDIRGTAIERSQDRQRKLDGIVTWYFDHVMESLPLMLQIALLLLGCALSRHLWEINITIASVVLSVTALGVTFYFSIVIAATTFEGCPYQTPGARVLRYILPHIFHALRSAPSTISVFVSFWFSSIIQASSLLGTPIWWWPVLDYPWCSMENIIGNLAGIFIGVFCLSPIALVVDAYRIGIATLWLLAVFCRMTYHWIVATSPQVHITDLRCISWMLQTSLDKEVHLSTLKHLESLMATPTSFDPALVTYCFVAFIGCINTSNCEVTITQGLEQLATVSAMCFFHTISHLSIMDPTSSVLDDINQRYTRIFPPETDFHGHGFSHAMDVIHRVFIRSADRRRFTWDDYKPPSDEYTLVAQTLEKLAKFGHQRTQRTKVPRLILRFALYSLSQDPLPPTPIIANCLSIVAIDLGCDVSYTGAMTLDERCAPPLWIVTALTLNQRTGGAGFEPYNSETRNVRWSRSSPFTPIQTQGDCRAPPICGLAGAKWAT